MDRLSSEKYMEEINELQRDLDYRSMVENIAIELISECRYEEAIEVLQQI